MEAAARSGKLDEVAAAHSTTPVIVGDDTEATPKADGRSSNRGKNKRERYSNQRKALELERFDAWQSLPGNEGKKTGGEYVHENGWDHHWEIKLGSGKSGGWNYPPTREEIFKKAASTMFAHLKVPHGAKLSKPNKFPLMEAHLRKIIVDRRKKKARVSENYCSVKARSLLDEGTPATLVMMPHLCCLTSWMVQKIHQEEPLQVQKAPESEEGEH